MTQDPKDKPTASSAEKKNLYSDRLHIVLDRPETELPELRSHLQDRGIQVYFDRPVPFSLEDAFIGTVQRTETGTSHSSD